MCTRDLTFLTSIKITYMCYTTHAFTCLPISHGSLGVDAMDCSLILSVPLPLGAVSGTGNELEELLHMWHLAFQPAFSGVCGFFPIGILILLQEGRAACAENGHSGSACCCVETSFSLSSIVRDVG